MDNFNQTECQCGNHNSPNFTTRRQFLGRFGMGLGGFALAERLFPVLRQPASAAAPTVTVTVPVLEPPRPSLTV